MVVKFWVPFLGNIGRCPDFPDQDLTRVDLVPCCPWKCVPTTISSGMDISKVPGYHL